MSELSEINRKLDNVLEVLSNLKTGQALADHHIDGLQAWCSRLDARIEEVSREMRALEQQNQRVELLKRDIDQVGDMVRSLEQGLKPTIKAAIDAALQPFQAEQQKQGFWWGALAMVGKGWWAAALVLLGATRDWWGK